jgi:putative membrane protein
MPVSGVRMLLLTLGLLGLALAWLGPLPRLASHSFAAHMTLHMAIVAMVAPLLALAAAGTTWDPVRAAPRLLAPIPASIVELLVVWTWHVPTLHHATHQQPWVLTLEQASFLMAGLLLWTAACGGKPDQRSSRAGAGVIALRFTSMHMTLLGALFALANRPLFQHATPASLPDQHLGGVIMLLVGGVSYLAGGLGLTARILRTSGRPTIAQEPVS